MNGHASYFLAALEIVCVSASLLWAGSPTQEGILGEIDQSQVVLMTRTSEVTFQINSSTQITRDGKTAKVTDLRMGDTATVEFSAQDDSSPLAVRIDAQAPSDPESPDPAPK